jgi:uncharacterized membrane protein YdjX (TVP38/TMEM64 family)
MGFFVPETLKRIIRNSMKGSTAKYLFFLGLIFLVFVGSYTWFSQTQYFEIVKGVAQNNKIAFIFILIIVKILSIIWPPLPGGLFTLGSIPFIGWPGAYFADFTGSWIGSSIAYFLGKKYGFSLLDKLFNEEIIKRIKSIKVKESKQTELVIVLRVFTGSIFLEAISYGAGIIGIKFSSFFLGSVISHIIVGVPVYMFAQKALVSPQNIVFNIVLIAIIFAILYKVKGRYFE